MKTAATILLVVLAVVLVYLLTSNRINPAACQTFDDYGSLSAEQMGVLKAILLCGENGATVITHCLSLAEFDEVIDHLGLYFGTILKHMNVALWRDGYAEVNPELVRDLERDKATLDAKIDLILSQMYEGTDGFKLWQISNYIAKTVIHHPALEYIEPLSGLDGKGSCATYAMLFYKMATRAGVQAYICYGNADNGKRFALHAWNMVVLKGKQYFYDVTWYDTPVPGFRYLHSIEAWGRSYTVSPLVNG